MSKDEAHRPKGTGAIEERVTAGGVTRHRARVHLGGNRRISKTFRTRGLAQEWLTKQLGIVEAGGTPLRPTAGKETVREYVWRWHGYRELRASTAAAEASRIAAWIAPRPDDTDANLSDFPLANLRLRDLRADDLRELKARMQAKGRTPSYIADVLGVLSKTLQTAQADGLIATVPTLGRGELPSMRTKAMRVLEVEEAELLANTIGDLGGTTSELLVRTALNTGMRWSELAGLKAKFLDLDAGTIRVEETLTEAAGRLVTAPPKTRASRRTIALPASLVRLLRAHVTAIADAYVFTTATGAPLRRTNWRRRVWEPAAAQLDDPKPTFHDLRHTHASWLIRAGQPITVVQQRLGHARPSITLDVYSHLLPGMDEGAAAAIDALWDSTGGSHIVPTAPGTVSDIKPQT